MREEEKKDLAEMKGRRAEMCARKRARALELIAQGVERHEIVDALNVRIETIYRWSRISKK